MAVPAETGVTTPLVIFADPVPLDTVQVIVPLVVESVNVELEPIQRFVLPTIGATTNALVTVTTIDSVLVHCPLFAVQ